MVRGRVFQSGVNQKRWGEATSWTNSNRCVERRGMMDLHRGEPPGAISLLAGAWNDTRGLVESGPG